MRLPFDDEIRQGPPELDGLPGLLHDSLPDGWARLVLDRRLRLMGHDPQALGPLDRLAFVGDAGPGALVYTGRDPLPPQAPFLTIEEAAAIVTYAPEDRDADRLLAAQLMTGSLSGAKPKIYAYLEGERLTTAGDPRGMSWIVKFRARSDGPEAGAVEYAYSLMARAAGIEMPRTALLPSNHCAGFFAVERFDRTADGGRLHMHSLGGMLDAPVGGNGLGYGELFRVTGHLTASAKQDRASIAEQVRRMAFNVLARNRDDHVKNHAFLMDGRGRWRVAPAFDLTFSNEIEHALLVGRAGRAPGREDMLDACRAGRMPATEANAIIDAVEEAVAGWRRYAKDAGVGRERAEEIGAAIDAGLDAGISAQAAMLSARTRGR